VTVTETETLHTDDHGRSVLRIRRRLPHPPAKVWRALTEPAELSRWYPFPATEVDLRVGGTIRFDAGDGPSADRSGGAVMAAVITELEPERAFGFRVPARQVLANEDDNLLHFALRPDGDGCLLEFTHVFHDRPAAASYAAGWDACLTGLDQRLAGRPVELPRSMTEAHEAYAAAFGLSAGSAEDTADGWRARFDRQLMQRPVETVWAALVPDPTAVGAPAPPALTTAAVPAGEVVAVEPCRLIEYEWRADGRVAGRVRWELSTTPPGARLSVTQTGPAGLPDARATALATWPDHLDRLARTLR
jgi:uncharacterized protein YndB with AHSA1/START domain